MAGHEQRYRSDKESYRQPDPPAFFTQIILHLDNGRMADTDTKEYSRTYYDSTEMHFYSKASISGPIPLA